MASRKIHSKVAAICIYCLRFTENDYCLYIIKLSLLECIDVEVETESPKAEAPEAEAPEAVAFCWKQKRKWKCLEICRFHFYSISWTMFEFW